VLWAEDLVRDKRFYADALGLKPRDVSGSASDGMGVFTAGDGTGVMIRERPGMPAPQNTALVFGVPADTFDEVVADLRAKGVTFEDYDPPEIRLETVNGIAEFEGFKAVWFKDSEGNTANIATM